MPCSQKGIAHIALIILAVFGIAIGLYLVQTRTNFLPKAQQEINLTPQTAFHLSPAVNYHLYDKGQGSTARRYGSNPDTTSSNESAGGSGKIAPQRSWFYPGEEIRVNVAVSSDIEAANTFSAIINFPSDVLEVTSIIKENNQISLKHPKMDSVLVEIINSPNREEFAKNRGLRFKDGKVQVTLQLDPQIVNKKAVNFKEYGFEEVARYETLVDGYIQVDSILKIAEVPNIKYIQATYDPATNPISTGSANTTTSAADRVCVEVITRACGTIRNVCPTTSLDQECSLETWAERPGCKDFPTPCDVPVGWEIEDPNLRGMRSCSPEQSCPSGYYCKDRSTCNDAGACTGVVGGDCYPNPSPVPTPSCKPIPSCVNQNPACDLYIDPNDPSWCHNQQSIKDYFISHWLPDTKFDNQTGRVILSGGVTGEGIKTIPPNKPIMATVIFKAKKAGEVKLEFGGDSLILRNSDSSNILTNKNGLTIQIQDPSKPVVKGDLDGDGSVGYRDFSILLSKWGSDDEKADINGDGKVNIYDFSILLTNWTVGKR